jgi:hypothetical protein
MKSTLIQSIAAKDGGDPYEIYHIPDGIGVRRGASNPMPGSATYKTVEMALLAVRVLEKTDGANNPDHFWDMWFRVTGATQRRRDINNAEAAAIGKRIVRRARYKYEWVDV